MLIFLQVFLIYMQGFSQECWGEKSVLSEEMLTLDLGPKRSEVSIEQFVPIKEKILKYINTHPEEKISAVAIISQTTTLPFWTNINGKKMIDPQAEEKSFLIAQDRAALASKLSLDWKKDLLLKNIEFDISAQKAGPEFKPIDLNLRFISKDSPMFESKIKEVWNEEMYQQTNVKSLKDLKQYPNVYLAKYLPFHGLRFKIIGQKKLSTSCDQKNESRPQGHKVKAY